MAIATGLIGRSRGPRSAARILPLRGLLCVLFLSGCAVTHGALGIGRGRSASPPGVTSATAMDIADHMRASGDLAGAISFYRRAIILNPANIKAYVALGNALLDAGYANDAAATFRAALAKEPKDAGAQTGLGAALVALDQPSRAVGVLRKGIATRPSARAYAALGVAEDLLGHAGAAAKAYRAGLAIAPEDLGLLNDLGLSQALQGNYDAAIGTLRRVAGSPRATARYRLNLALALGLAGRTSEAARVASIDLDQRSVLDNLAYYAELRAMGPRARAAAILNPRSALSRTAAVCDSARCGGSASDVAGWIKGSAGSVDATHLMPPETLQPGSGAAGPRRRQPADPAGR